MTYTKSIAELRQEGNQWAMLLYRDLVPKGYKLNKGVFSVEYNGKTYFATSEIEAMKAKELMEAGKEIDFTLENIKVWDSTARVLS